MRIGFLGGTGIEGKGLALRFAQAGAEVIIGSRSKERAETAATQYNNDLGNAVIQGMGNLEMIASSEIVFLTVPSNQAVAAIDSCRDALSTGPVVVDVTVPIEFREGKPVYIEQDAGSNAELLASRLPAGAHLVVAFKTIPAHILAEIETPLQCDVFVCSDSKEAKDKVMQAARLIPTLRPLDAGPLQSARILERMTFLAIQLNRRYQVKGARFRIEGL